LGKRYTEEEQRHTQELVEQGHTDESIAQQLGRSTNAIRNLRHRNSITTKETINIEQLKQEKQELNKQTQEIYKLLR